LDLGEQVEEDQEHIHLLLRHQLVMEQLIQVVEEVEMDLELDKVVQVDQV
jgi:hypothetical protein